MLPAPARRWVAAVAAAGVVVAGSVALAAPAGATPTPACGGAAQGGLTIAASHDAVFYTDLGHSLDAAYLGYRITNSGAARTNLWVKVSAFAGGSVTLADATADRQQIAALAGSASATAYFLAKATAVTASAQTHTVTVYDRRPDLTGASALATCTFSFTSVADTIAASANKVTAIASSPASPSIGQTVTVTVDGETGQTSGAMWVSPAASSTWPSKALRLESTLLEVNTNGSGAVEETYTNQLYIPSVIAANYTAQTTYRATYVFRVTGATGSNPSIKPIAQIASGGQFKHTGSYPTLPTISSSGATASIALAKSITAGSVVGLPQTATPNGVVGGGVTYAEVPYRVTGTVGGSGTAVVDEFVDVPATGMIFQAGSARLTDAAGNTAAVAADPSTSSSDSGSRLGALHFTGPFSATSGTAARIDYTMYVPLTAGSYTNQAFATLNGTTIGATASNVPTVTVSADGAGLTSWSAGTAGAGSTAQTITFTQPSDVALAAGTRAVSATATSALAVSFTSATTAVCTVSGTTVTLVGAGTCTLSAAQAGDATYAAASTVTRSFAVSALSPQTITFAQPADVQLSAGSATVSATATSTLGVDFTSSTPSVCTVAGTTVTLQGDGTCTIAADQAGDGTWSAATTVSRSFQVTLLPAQTITFTQPGDATLQTTPAALVATSTSSLTVDFASATPGVCTVSGTTVTLVSAGTCTIEAGQAGDGSYAAASPVTRSFTVAKRSQTITFTQAGVPMLPSPVTLTGTASSSLGVTYTGSTPSVCTVSGTAVTLVSEGTCTVTADQAGDATYLPAGAVARSFAVSLVPQTITFPVLADVTGTSGTVPLAATASSGLTVSFTGSTPAVCTVSGSTVTLLDTGTCTVTADQLGDGSYEAASVVPRSFTVSPEPAPPAPPSAPPAITTTGPGGQSGTVPVPPGGSVGLVDPAAAPGTTPGAVTTVTMPGQGSYTLDPATGTITFLPAPGFVGSPDPVTFQVMTPGGAVTTATYTPTVVPVEVPPTSAGTVRGHSLTLAPATPDDDTAVLPATLRLVDPAGRPTTSLTVAAVGRFDVEPGAGHVVFTPLATFTGTSTVGYRITDTRGVMLQSAMAVTIEGWNVTAVRVTVDSGATGRVALAGLPPGGRVSAPATAAGATSVAWAGNRVVVATRRGFAGLVHVPVTVSTGAASVTVDAVVAVRPLAPLDPHHGVGPAGRTAVEWRDRPGAGPRTYTVTVAGRTACRTTGRSCTLGGPLGPRAAVTVTATAAGLTSSVARAAFRQTGCGALGVVHFDVGSAALTPATRAELDRVAARLRSGRFTHGCLVGHTDTAGSDAYNLDLSRRRVQAVSDYLAARTGGLRFGVTYRGERDPAVPDRGESARAANRRVVIGVG